MEKSYTVFYKSHEFSGTHQFNIKAESIDDAKNKFYKLGYPYYKIISIKRIDHKDLKYKDILGKGFMH